MKKQDAHKLIQECKKARNEFDAYNSISKQYRVSCQGQEVVFDEMVSGHIKHNGSEIARNYNDLIDQIDPAAKIEEIN